MKKLKKIASLTNCLLVVAFLVCCSGAARGEESKEARGSDQAATLRLYSKPTKEKICVGEPVFLQLTLKNEGQTLQELSMDLAESLHGEFWKLELGDNGAFREVTMSSGHWMEMADNPPLKIASGQGVSEILTIWRCSRRRLVFPSPGEYPYLLTLHVRAKPTDPPIVLTTGGRINVVEGGEDSARFVAFLRDNMFRNETVRYRERKVVETFLTQFDADSPYAKYLKWLRIRCYLVGGSDEDGMNPLEGRGADDEAALLSKLSEELLATASKEQEPPIVRDALAVKGILLVLSGNKDEARKIYEALEATYGYTAERRLSHQPRDRMPSIPARAPILNHVPGHRGSGQEAARPSDAMRALIEVRYNAWLDYLDQHRMDDPVRAFSSRFDRQFNFDNEPFRALVALGPRAVPSMITLMEQDDKYARMGHVLQKVTKFRFNIHRTKDGVWMVEEFPDMSTKGPIMPRSKDIWVRWLKDVREQAPIWLERRHADWLAAIKAGNALEAARKYERIFDLGITALPAMVERIKNGDEDLIPVFSRLVDGAVGREVPPVHIENWWKENRTQWELPEVE